LIGRAGLLPAGDYLKGVQQVLGTPRAYFLYPTLAWLNSSDAFLKAMCWAGAGLSLALLLGLGTTPVLALLWLLYLSLTTAGQVFLSYQWDALLLEAGFLSIFLVPPSLTPGQAAALPAPLVVFLMRWLLFRLIFMSGLAKLASGDPTWRNLSALSFHYETQPIPNPLAFWMFQLHLPFQRLSTLFALAIELLVPFLYFGPRPFRLAGFLLTVGFMLLIEATGNFAFFNLLAIALAVFLLDDRLLSRLGPLEQLRSSLLAGLGPTPAWWQWVVVPVAILSILVGGLFLLSRLTGKGELLRPIQPVLPLVSAYRLVNSYGLFSVMTTSRPEIVLEGSQDGRTWQEYQFRYKPGDLKRPPPIVAPHQPRLDWQMWFAALRGDYLAEPWFISLVERLFTNQPAVTRLLAHNPFPDQPPRFIRARLFDYKFTSPAELSQSGTWWRREPRGYYLPPVSLSSNP
jgi:hypothetical protein